MRMTSAAVTDGNVNVHRTVNRARHVNANVQRRHGPGIDSNASPPRPLPIVTSHSHPRSRVLCIPSGCPFRCAFCGHLLLLLGGSESSEGGCLGVGKSSHRLLREHRSDRLARTRGVQRGALQLLLAPDSLLLASDQLGHGALYVFHHVVYAEGGLIRQRVYRLRRLGSQPVACSSEQPVGRGCHSAS